MLNQIHLENKQRIKDYLLCENHHCFKCGISHFKVKGGLELHRLIPNRYKGTYILTNCILLCKKCHKLVENSFDNFYYIGESEFYEKKIKIEKLIDIINLLAIYQSLNKMSYKEFKEEIGEIYL